MSRLTLVVPELLCASPESGQAGFPAPTTPVLNRMLARAHRHESRGERAALLLALFGIDRSAPGSLPLAAIMRVGQGGKPDQAWWLRLDPVHLEPDIDKVVLQPPGALPLKSEDNRLFGSLLQRCFGHFGGVLEPAEGGGWYLGLNSDPEISAVPPTQLDASDRLQVLPAGPGASAWHRAITEVQMILHRQSMDPGEKGKALMRVNSVWVWGIGRCPATAAPPAALVHGQGGLLHGLGRLAGVEVVPVPEGAMALFAALGAAGSALVVLDPPLEATAQHNPWAWQEWLEQLEAQWFGPCWRVLQRGELGSMVIYPGLESRFQLDRRSSWRLWRRQRSVVGWTAPRSER
jgi:hypothetical protein